MHRTLCAFVGEGYCAALLNGCYYRIGCAALFPNFSL